MLGPSWNGCYGLNYGLLLVPPYYLYNARSPLSHLLGETGHFLLLGGISLVFSMGFLCFTGNFQSQHGVREVAWESSWAVWQDEYFCGPSRQWDALGRQGAGCGAPDIPPVLCGLPRLPLKCFQCQDETSEDAGTSLFRFWTADLSKLRHDACTSLSSNYFLILGGRRTRGKLSPLQDLQRFGPSALILTHIIW